MPPPRIIQDVGSIVKRFKLQELETAILPHFPEISWSELIEKLIKNRETLTVKNAVAVIQAELNRTKLSNKVLEERLGLLEVVDISRHYHRRTWYAYLLKDPIKQRTLSNEQLKLVLKKEFLIFPTEVSINIVCWDDTTYVSIRNKSKRANKSIPNSLFFAFCTGEKYFFCSNKMVTKQLVKILAKSLGYLHCRPLRLFGHDLKSLAKILRTRIQLGANTKNCNKTTYEMAAPIVKESGINFIQQKQRNAFARECFGKNPPILHTFCIKPSNHSWYDQDETAPRLDDTDMGWEFRSRNVGNLMADLIERKIFVPPIPHYITNMMALGKNLISLENDQSENLNLS